MKAADARLARRPGQAHARALVDLDRQLRVEVAERVVGERGRVEDRVMAAQVVLAEIADVALHALDLGAGVQVAAG